MGILQAQQLTLFLDEDPLPKGFPSREHVQAAGLSYRVVVEVGHVAVEGERLVYEVGVEVLVEHDLWNTGYELLHGRHVQG